MSYEEVIEKMLEYGVDSMPGGGAEILMKRYVLKFVRVRLAVKIGLKFTKFGIKKLDKVTPLCFMGI